MPGSGEIMKKKKDAPKNAWANVHDDYNEARDGWNNKCDLTRRCHAPTTTTDSSIKVGVFKLVYK